MGKPDKKGSELQQQQAGTSKLGLGPLNTSTKTTGFPANRQQLMSKVGTAAGDAPMKLATVKELLDQQLLDLKRGLDQQSAKFDKLLASTSAVRDNMAQEHQKQANQVPPQATLIDI
jgi:hypothetical protein